MSSDIWTRCAGDSELRPLRLEPWRAVESQHQVATRRLVDTAAEHEVLERLIDDAKPPAPTAPPRRTDAARAAPGMHYLLFTPFRYPPLRHGSRFGARTERGIWYGGEALRTVFAEVSYYRLVFLEGTAADLGVLEVDLTAFRARVRTERGIDLTAPPFAAHEAELASPVSYGATQALGGAMRDADVGALRYRSARDVEGGANVAVLDPAAFGRRAPRSFETWHCAATTERVEVASRGYARRETFAYPREDFLVDGQLPTPAV
jgi:hypothetical protein